MFVKALAFFAIVGAIQAIEHAYSSQSIVRYDDHNQEHHVPVNVAVPVVTKVALPVVTKVSLPVVSRVAVPVTQYVSQGPESSHHAVSSQSIQRHDVPAHPPADFYEHHGPAKYEFEYKVEDPHTGDNKFQHEIRDGYVLKGVYSLHEADGSIRTVDYSSDKHTGFIANVKQTTKHIEQPKH